MIIRFRGDCFEKYLKRPKKQIKSAQTIKGSLRPTVVQKKVDGITKTPRDSATVFSTVFLGFLEARKITP